MNTFFRRYLSQTKMTINTVFNVAIQTLGSLKNYTNTQYILKVLNISGVIWHIKSLGTTYCSFFAFFVQVNFNLIIRTCTFYILTVTFYNDVTYLLKYHNRSITNNCLMHARDYHLSPMSLNSPTYTPTRADLRELHDPHRVQTHHTDCAPLWNTQPAALPHTICV